jgi:hypothetical protein
LGGTVWLLDSGCSNHMTGEKDLFTSLELHDIPKETIIFGDNVGVLPPRPPRDSPEVVSL